MDFICLVSKQDLHESKALEGKRRFHPLVPSDKYWLMYPPLIV